jgi:hypothetical protein
MPRAHLRRLEKPKPIGPLNGTNFTSLLDLPYELKSRSIYASTSYHPHPASATAMVNGEPINNTTTVSILAQTDLTR